LHYNLLICYINNSNTVCNLDDFVFGSIAPFFRTLFMLKLFIFYILFFAAAMLLPTLRVWRQTGVNPLVLPSTDNTEGFVGRMFKVIIAALGIYLLLGGLALIQACGAIMLPLQTAALGWTLLIASFMWVVIAQFHMGRSWRIGIDAQIKTDLVAEGLFRVSRNPIFLGMIMQLAGLFLVQPDAATWSVLITSFVLISLQIRLEEAHLSAMHGEAYARYCSKVRRWI
jgi:protein-S-isoprenylcysteine O-methyltransferase Ste14